MIDNLPAWIKITFTVIVIISILFFYFSNGKPKLLTGLIIFWSVMQSVLAYNDFYQVIETTPPRFAFVLLPTTLLFIYAFLPKQINWAVANRNYKISTFLHTIRIPVEIVLYYLFVHKMIPELMTFEGRNFDILAGITAPIVGFFLLKKKLSKKVVIAWNICSLILVSFILINGLLSAELPIQQFGFDQPNKAVAFFPFVLLPATVVPIVIYTHVIDIIKLKREITLV